MIKPYELGMTVKENNASSVEAGGSYINGAVGTVSDGVFTVSSTALDYVMLDKSAGDTAYDDFTVESGSQVKVYELSAWDGKDLCVSPANFVYAASSDYSDLAVGTTHFTVSSSTGKLVQVTATTTDTDYFQLTAKINFDGQGVRVTKVHTADA